MRHEIFNYYGKRVIKIGKNTYSEITLLLFLDNFNGHDNAGIISGNEKYRSENQFYISINEIMKILKFSDAEEESAFWYDETNDSTGEFIETDSLKSFEILNNL